MHEFQEEWMHSKNEIQYMLQYLLTAFLEAISLKHLKNIRQTIKRYLQLKFQTIFCLWCLPGRSMASACADTTQLVTTASAVHLSTTANRGRLPTASQGHRMSARVSDRARESNAVVGHTACRLILKLDLVS